MDLNIGSYWKWNAVTFDSWWRNGSWWELAWNKRNFLKDCINIYFSILTLIRMIFLFASCTKIWPSKKAT